MNPDRYRDLNNGGMIVEAMQLTSRNYMQVAAWVKGKAHSPDDKFNHITFNDGWGGTLIATVYDYVLVYENGHKLVVSSEYFAHMRSNRLRTLQYRNEFGSLVE